MSHNCNPKDYYLIVYIDTGEVYEDFRTKGGADIFLGQHALKDYLEVIPNPKYIVTTK